MGIDTSFYVGPMIVILSKVEATERYFVCPVGHKKVEKGRFCSKCGNAFVELSRAIEKPFNAFVFEEWGLAEDELYQPAWQGDENCLLPNRSGYGWSGDEAGDAHTVGSSDVQFDIEQFEEYFAPYITALDEHDIEFVVSYRALIHAS